MDNSSDSATADSVPQQEEQALEAFHDPNSAYPHASSLRNPQGIVHTKDQTEYEFRDNNDLAIQYVQGIHGELRFPAIPAKSGKNP